MSIDSETRVLVTGASSGIGAAVVRALRAEDVEVHAAARRADRLDALAAETGCVSHILDVTDEPAVAALCASLLPNVLINNAGLGRAMGSLVDASAEDIERTVSTNVTSAIHVVRAVLPSMIDQGRGHIVNLSSATGLYAAPAALYGATKGAMHLLSLNLRQELKGTGIKVTEICPGRVATEFYDVAVDDPETRAAFKASGVEDLTPEDVAEAIVYALSVPWRVNIGLIEMMPTEQTYGGAEFSPRSVT